MKPNMKPLKIAKAMNKETPITYYIIGNKKLSIEEFKQLNIKPILPYCENFGVIKNIAQKLYLKSEIHIDTNTNEIKINPFCS